jgi:uncharacterized integral membrane protein
MPWRLIGFIVLFAIFLTFIGFNLENSCAISFGFVQFDQVPVYLTAFASFIFGMLCTIPFALSFRFKKKHKSAVKAKDGSPMIDASQAASAPASATAPKKLSKKEKEAAAEINQSDYGIN